MVVTGQPRHIESSATTADIVRTVIFKARDLEELNRQVTGWLMEHPSATPLSLSHATETRYTTADPVSLAGTKRVMVYTAVLLSRSV